VVLGKKEKRKNNCPRFDEIFYLTSDVDNMNYESTKEILSSFLFLSTFCKNKMDKNRRCSFFSFLFFPGKLEKS
jgi:hypothetical protein